MLSAVPSGVGQMGQQTPALGKDESLFLCLCPGVHAASLRNLVLRPAQIRSHFGDRFWLMSLSTARMFASLCPIDGGALPKWKPKVAGDHAALRFSLCRWYQMRLLGPKSTPGEPSDAIPQKSPCHLNSCLLASWCWDLGRLIFLHLWHTEGLPGKTLRCSQG